MKINTLLFDLDGTLIDTNELIVQSFLHTLDKYCPNEYKREDVYQFMGPTLEESFTKVKADKMEEMTETYRAFNKQEHDNYVKEFDSVYETIKTLKEQGYKLGIVTTKVRDVVMMGMNLARLTEFFDVIVTIDDVVNAKPHPEPVQKAMALLGSIPEETIMVGDNYHDIEGGQNAGVKTAAVAWSIKGKEFLASYNPDYMLGQLSDLLEIVGAK